MKHSSVSAQKSTHTACGSHLSYTAGCKAMNRTCHNRAEHFLSRRIDASAANISQQRGPIHSTIPRTHSIVSFESTDGTNWLLMNSPVGTLIVLPVAGTAISTTAAIVSVRWMVVVERRRRDPADDLLIYVREYSPDKQRRMTCQRVINCEAGDRRRNMQRPYQSAASDRLSKVLRTKIRVKESFH